MKLITDLERIGDEADRIAKIAVTLSRYESPSNQYADFRQLHSDVVAMLNRALDAFARLDVGPQMPKSMAERPMASSRL